MLAFRPAQRSDEPWLRMLFASSQPALCALAALPDDLGQRLLQMQYDARQAQYGARWPRAVQQLILAPLAVNLAASHDDQDCAAQAQSPEPGTGTRPGTAVGMVWTVRSTSAIHVLDMALLPPWRGLGIGSRCLRALLDQAAVEQRAVKLQVARDNPARRLYARLGFVPDDAIDATPASHTTPKTEAGDDVHLRLICRPRSTHPTENCHEQA